jgi:hypothetical protein
MAAGVEVDFSRSFGIGLRLDADAGLIFWVALWELFSDLNHGGRQMLGSSGRGWLDPEHELCKGEGTNDESSDNEL